MKFKTILLFLISVVFLSFIFLKKSIKIEKTNKEVEKNGLYIFNVLEKEDFLDARIKGSSHCSLEKINEILSEIDKSNILVFYCANYFCSSSDDSAINAYKKGFKNIYVYKGGTAEWYQLSLNDKNYEIEGPAKGDYLNFVIQKKSNFFEDEKNDKYYKFISSEKLQELIKSNKLYTCR
jgi:rhodanese-related sulfurtransferase